MRSVTMVGAVRDGRVAIRPRAMVWHPRNGVVLEFADDQAPGSVAFWLPLGPSDAGCESAPESGGFVLFERVVANPRAVWKSTRWHREPSAALGPVACLPSVLWTSRGVASAAAGATPSSPREGGSA